MTTRPPIRSVSMPAGSRQSEPLSTATAQIQASSGSLSPSSFWIGTPRMPNMSHTANMRVNAIVDIVRTRFAPSETCTYPGPTAGTARSVIAGSSVLRLDEISSKIPGATLHRLRGPARRVALPLRRT